MIEDIKIVQRYDWRVKDNGEMVWDAVSYMIMVKRDGQWSEVEVQHINPFPPEEENREEPEGSS
jgi:hypothetical protein